MLIIFQKIVDISIWCKSRKLKNPPKPKYKNLRDQMLRPLVSENEYAELPKGSA